MLKNKVLILDDEQNYLDKYQNWLQNKGIKFEVTQSADEAIEKVKSNLLIKVVLIDEILYDKNGQPQNFQGFDVREEIRKYRSDVKFIVITSKDGKSQVPILKEPQVTHFLSKEILNTSQLEQSQYERLIKEINELLGNHETFVYWNIIKQTMLDLAFVGMIPTPNILTEVNKVNDQMVEMIKEIMQVNGRNDIAGKSQDFYKNFHKNLTRKSFRFQWISPLFRWLGFFLGGFLGFLKFGYVGSAIGGISGILIVGVVAALLYAFQAAEFGIKTMSYCCKEDD